MCSQSLKGVGGNIVVLEGNAQPQTTDTRIPLPDDPRFDLMRDRGGVLRHASRERGGASASKHAGLVSPLHFDSPPQ